MTSHEVVLEVPADCDVEGVAAGGTATITVPEHEYVLAAARAQDVWLPADCQRGWCTTCAAQRLAGEVDQADATRYYESDREADLVLLCTAKPLSDCRFRVCQEEAMLAERTRQDKPPGRSY